MPNCKNCGAAANIYNDGCDYCGTNAPIKRHVSRVDLGDMPRGKAQKMLEDFWVPVEREDYTFNPQDWGHYDAACHWWRTECGHNVELIRYYIERYGDDAPRAWQNDMEIDWPRRVR